MTRKIIRIDVSNMSEKEFCETIGMKYTPWYKDLIFWSIVLLCSSQFCVTLISIMKG
jgi:hypothetical protein